ncbi:MAG: hypothetical protein ACKOA1_08955, partial [Bacteroidota bacterium]
MNHKLRTTHPVSRWFALALLFCFIGSMKIQAQTSVNLCANQLRNVAWFGIDADLYANSPNDPIFYNSDDWFFDASVLSPGNNQGIGVISEGLSQSMSSSGEPLFQATAADFRNHLINATSVVDRNVRFEERMVVPPFFGRVQGGDTIVYLDGVAGRDNFSTSATLDSSMFAGNGNKNGDNPATWSLGIGNVPQKNDLVDVGGHIRYLRENGVPKLYGYAFASRLETNGDNHVDFEIIREPFVSFNPANGHPINTGSPLTGGHNVGYTDATGFTTHPGDVLIAIDYDNGGTNPTYSVRVWIKPDSLGVGINSFASFNDTIAHPNVPFLFTGVFDSGIGANGYGYAEISPRRASSAQCLVYAQTNSITATKGTPWGNIINPGANFTNDIQQLQLISCAIDFTEFGLDATRFSTGAECANLFGSLLVKTRSSTSFTASLKDYAGPYLFGNFSSLNVAANGGTVTCSSPIATLTATVTGVNPANATIVWSGPGTILSGQGTNTVTVSTPGTYTVAVSDLSFSNCTRLATATVVADTCSPSVSATNDGPITCTNTSRTITASATACDGSALSYAWSTGSTSSSFSTTNAGAYSVTVTQAGNGCSASASTTLNQNTTTPTVTCAPGADITCSNTSSSISASATASAGNTITGYSWSPSGATTSSISVNNGDSYTVTVTQSNGCTSTCSSSVPVDTCKPSVSPSNNGPITCANPSRTVSANAAACAGKSIASYSWTPSGSGASFTTGNAATYSVTVTQSVNGCTATGSTTLAVDTCKPSVTASNNGPITCTNPSRTVSASATACDGSTLSYAWSNSNTNASFTTSTAGTYSVTVEQAGNGCSATASTTLASNNTNPTVNCVPGADITCTNSTSTITANATASATNTITGYAWSPGGSTNSTITVNNGSTYTVVVTQSNGCTATCNSAVVVDT